MQEQEQQEPMETLKIVIAKKRYADGTENTEVHGTNDPILALNMLHDGQTVLVNLLTQQKMEGGEAEEKPRIIIPHMRISEN